MKKSHYTTYSLVDNMDHREEFKTDMEGQPSEYVEGVLQHSIATAMSLAAGYAELGIEKNDKGYWPYVEGYRVQAALCGEVLAGRLKNES